MTQFTRRDALLTGLVGAVASRVDASSTSREFSFHYDHILGTSLDVWGNAADPATVECTVLAEIERLRSVFSLYDPASELSQLNRADAVLASPDLLAVLREYEHWQRVSNGACNPRVGELIRLWKDAERDGVEPDPADLDDLARAIASPAWRRNGLHVHRLSNHTLDLNSVAKGYILQLASEAVRKQPGVTGLLLNLGGDLCAWGEAPSLIGIQDPHQPYENAAPLTAVRLTDAAIATSGAYQRYYTIGGRRYSHLIDPRSGRPADGIASATVIAPTSILANVLATTLCVLSPDEGLRLIAATPGTECLLVTANGKPIRSNGFAAYEVALRQEPTKPKSEAWPAEHQVTVALELPKMMGGSRYRRPYVAVWVENADGKLVRSISVWGNQIRWVPELSGWWKFAKGNRELINAVCKATRAPGKYEVVWDGKDDKGTAVPQGTYTIKVEVHREHGKHVTQTGKIVCGAEAAKVTLEKNAETEETVVEYAKKKKDDKKDEKK